MLKSIEMTGAMHGAAEGIGPVWGRDAMPTSVKTAPSRKSPRLEGPKTDALTVLLRNDIVRGRLQPGQALPDRNVLSRRYHVSPPTVSVAIGRLAEQGFVRRVRGQGSFVSRQVPVQSKTVAFIWGKPGKTPRQDPGDVADIYARLCEEKGYNAVWHILPYETMIDTEAMLPRFEGVRGVMGRFVPPELLDAIHQRSIPVVAAARQVGSGPARYPTFDSDRSAILDMAVHHLLGVGYRRIAYLGRGLHEPRTIGFLEAATRYRLDLPMRWVIPTADYYLTDATAQIVEILKEPNRPEAFCCTSDHYAALLERLILDRGLSVPGDIAVIAADTGHEHGTPVPLTTVGVAREAACRITMEALDAIESGFDPDQTALQPVSMLPLALTVCESCGARLRGVVTPEQAEKSQERFMTPVSASE